MTSLPTSLVGTRFKRLMRVEVVGPDGVGRAFDGLHMTCEIGRTDAPEPDQATVRLFNLNDTSRGFVQAAAPMIGSTVPKTTRVVRVFAGHAGLSDTPPLLFSGDITAVTTKREGTERITEITAGEARRAYTETRIAESFAPPQTAAVLLGKLAESMGLVADIGPGLAPLAFNAPFVAHGPARKVIGDLVRSLGAHWSIRGGRLIVTADGVPTTEDVVLLTPESGLIGSVERDAGDNRVRGRTLLDGRLMPRRRIQIQSASFTGLVVLKAVSFTADSGDGGEFFADFEGTPID